METMLQDHLYQSNSNDKLHLNVPSPAKYNVTLTDSGTPPLSSTVQVVVVVKDENDNSPQFDQTFYHIMIPEVQNKESTFIIQNEVDASESDLEFEALFVGEAWHSLDSDNLTGYPVFRLLAVDSDCDNNGKVQYQVKSSHDRFSIHQHSGVVFAQRPVLANHDFDLLVKSSHDRFSIHQHSRLVFAQRPVFANHDFDLLVKSSHDRFSIHQHSRLVFAQRPVFANHDFDLLVKSSHDRFSIHQHSRLVFAQRPVFANHDFDLLVVSIEAIKGRKMDTKAVASIHRARHTDVGRLYLATYWPCAALLSHLCARNLSTNGMFSLV
ncbi:hypothetical protein J6590_085120 [Homalodisca vitripennis]|nr:hypothetical protein J6590_085120 [Homalodisca vitripennis]